MQLSREIVRELKDGDKIIFEYTTNKYPYKPETFTLRCNKDVIDKNELCYIITQSCFQMNVKKVGSKIIKLFSYDMMSQRTDYNLRMNECKIIGIERKNEK